MLTVSDREYDYIRKINREVNNSIRYKTDLELYKSRDKWTIPGKYGDCEDYALLKRLKLIDAGFPALELKIAICKTETGEGHAVLTIDTNRGSLVLDNRYPDVKTHRQLLNIGYKFLQRQDGKTSNGWVKLSE